jgi:hypothetical protein
MFVTLVKIFGEKDNSGSSTEFFRVYRGETLLISPQLNTTIRLYDGSFYINNIEQNLEEQNIYLYEENWFDSNIFWGNKEKFLELKEKLIEEQWLDENVYNALERSDNHGAGSE